MSELLIISVETLVEALRPYADLLLPLIFLGFFFLSTLAIIFSDRKYIKKSYVSGFLVVLLLFQTIMPLYITPFINWHKFSSERPAESAGYEVHIVDESGNEIQLDRKATLAFNGVASIPSEQMVTNNSNETNQEIAQWILKRTSEYRAEVERGEPTRGAVPSDVWNLPHRLYRFPAHSVGAWTADELSGFSEFIGIRIYYVQTETSSDGSQIVSQSEELVLEIYPEKSPDNSTEVA